MQRLGLDFPNVQAAGIQNYEKWQFAVACVISPNLSCLRTILETVQTLGSEQDKGTHKVYLDKLVLVVTWAKNLD